MPSMGRKRVRNLDLPPRMRFSDGGYYFDSYGNGRPRKWIFLGRDLRQARAAWASMLNESDTSTFAALHDKFISECIGHLSEGTQLVYTTNGNVLRSAFGDDKLAGITPQHIAQYLDTHPSKSSANNQVMLMGLMFEKAMRWGWTTNNPCRGVRRNKIKQRDRYVTDAEFVAVRACAPAWLRVAMDFSYITSIRRSDVLKLRLSDIQDDGIHVVHKKTGKHQVFTMTGALQTAVADAKALPRVVGSMFLLSRHDGQPIKGNTLSVAMQTACEKAGCAPFHFHDIRAKAATDASRNGEDYFLLLGHANRATSDRYVKPREVDVVRSGRGIL